MSTVRSEHGGQSTGQARDSKPFVKPIISTDADVQQKGRDGKTSDIGAGSQRATVQPDLKFVASKTAKTIGADQN